MLRNRRQADADARYEAMLYCLGELDANSSGEVPGPLDTCKEITQTIYALLDELSTRLHDHVESQHFGSTRR